MTQTHTITVEPFAKHVTVRANGAVVASSDHAMLLKEHVYPPVIYIPFADTRMDLLRETPVPRTHCEWKGVARYFDLELGDNRVEAAAWHYPDPRRA